jgi:hypothetical protein
MILRTTKQAKTLKYDAHDMFWCVETHGNTEGVTWDDIEAWQVKSTRPFDSGVYLAHNWYSFEDQDQAQDEDEV